MVDTSYFVSQVTPLLKYESKYYDITSSLTIRKGLFSPTDGFQLWLGEKISKLKAQIREYYLKKIIDFYDSFSSEKELLKGLISTELYWQKATEEERLSLQEKKDTIYNQIKEKIGEEEIKKVKIILGCCEELVQLENKFGLIFELKERLEKVDNLSYQNKIELFPTAIFFSY